MKIILIAAVGNQGQLGLDGKLPWHNPEDLAEFRCKTMGHVVVMGRKTAESLGKPLEGRTNIVMSRQRMVGFCTARSLIEMDCILGDIVGDPTIYVIGGAEIYKLFMPMATGFDITRIDYDGPADTYWPGRLPWV